MLSSVGIDGPQAGEFGPVTVTGSPGSDRVEIVYSGENDREVRISIVTADGNCSATAVYNTAQVDVIDLSGLGIDDSVSVESFHIPVELPDSGGNSAQSESFFERIGVDFDFDVDATFVHGNATPAPDLNFGLGSFDASHPVLGGFQQNAGLQFGLAILSDIEVFLFLKAAQNDNVLEAPQVTLFNGQSADVTDSLLQPFVTSVTPVVGVSGPQIQPFGEGANLVVLAVISADRRFVRLDVQPSFSQTNIQQPVFTYISVSTTVSVPDGGTILPGGIDRLREGRNETSVPLLNRLPYVNRLFKNVGTGRDSQSLMLMVTPRIIIQ